MKNNSGNALFLILIAVALFAALSYAVTSSGRGGSGIDREKNEIAVSEIMQWLASVDAGILRMKILPNLNNENISFAYNTETYGGTALNDYMENPNCATDECKVFDMAGGGVHAADFYEHATKDPTGIAAGSLKPGSFTIRVVQWPSAGTTANDVVMRLAYLRPDICQTFNDKVGVGAAPVFTGTYNLGHNPATWDNPGNTITTNASEVIGKNSFAGRVSGTGNGENCSIYHLLFAR